MSDLVFEKRWAIEMVITVAAAAPSTHGVLRFVVNRREIIRIGVQDVGYDTGSIEEVGERCTYAGYMPDQTIAVDYLAAMSRTNSGRWLRGS